MLIKIISGGQTGVDRGALDAALKHGVKCGGWCPEGREAEDGKIPDKYPLTEVPGGSYKHRTLQNIIGSDGTVIIYFGDLEGGTEETAFYCMKKGMPYKLIDLKEISIERAKELVTEFIDKKEIETLNVAGPRASRVEGAYDYAFALFDSLLTDENSKPE
jgi:hypothetical protein